MAKGMIAVPKGTLTADEIELVAAKLFKIGYAVKKRTIKTGENKGGKVIEYWIEEEPCTST